FVVAFVAGYAVLAAAFEPRGRKATILLAGGLVTVGVGLAAIQLVPTIRYVPHSARSHITYEQAVTYSLPVSHIPLVTFPYLFGTSAPTGPVRTSYGGAWNLTEMSGYPGLAAVVLAAAGLSVLKRDRRLRALALVGAGCFAVALGASTPIAPILYRLPVYGQFRAWARYLVGVDLVIALLAGAGVVALRQARTAERRAAVGRSAAALVLL